MLMGMFYSGFFFVTAWRRRGLCLGHEILTMEGHMMMMMISRIEAIVVSWGKLNWGRDGESYLGRECGDNKSRICLC